MESAVKQRARVDARYRTSAALDEWSQYRLFPEERYLMDRYYRPGQTVLDHACGAGRTTLLLHEMGMRVTGADISPIAVDLAHRRFPYLRLQQGSFTDVAAPDATFDHVLVSFNSLDHAYPESERVRALREFARVLKTSGTLLVSSHNLKSLHFSPFYIYYFPGDRWRLRWMLRNTLRAFRDRSYLVENGMPNFYGSPEYIIKQVNAQGFQFIDAVGLLASRKWWFNKYVSPYIHYMFKRVPSGVRNVTGGAG